MNNSVQQSIPDEYLRKVVGRRIEDLSIFVRMQGMKYDSMQTMTAQYTMPYGLTIPFLHAKGLITLKTGSLREKDQFDVVALKSLLQKEQQLEPTSEKPIF
ncbi:MAG TPA: hypothetical protein VJK54_04650 [Chthoniobacterales bacterium]|nr:hypothetical protein [Chthoniobacterales bacterium]